MTGNLIESGNMGKERINIYADLRRYMSDQLARINTECYTAPFEDLLEEGTDNLLELMRKKYGFKWGDSVPSEISIEQIFDTIDRFAIHNQSTRK